MRWHPTAPVNSVRTSVATSGSDFIAPETDFAALIRAAGFCPRRSHLSWAFLRHPALYRERTIYDGCAVWRSEQNFRPTTSGIERPLTCVHWVWLAYIGRT